MRLADRDADRRRQEPLLPAPGSGLARPDRGRQPADRADERPVAAALRRRPPGDDDRLGDERGSGARRPGHGPRRRGADRLLLARALRLAGLPRRPRPAPHRPARRRRGPLRLRVGARLPARLPAPAADRRPARPADGDGLHGDGDRNGRGRDRHPLRDARPARGPLRLRPAQSLLRRRPARRDGLEGAAHRPARSGPRRPRKPPGDRLLRNPQGHRRGGGRPAGGRPRRGPLPRGHGRRGADRDPEPFHGGRGRGDRRHQRLRHGGRQGRRALGLARGDPDQRRGLLPGGRARRARRPAGQGGASGDALRPRPPGPLQRTAQPRPGDRPRARLAGIPGDQILHLLGSLPAAAAARPLQRPHGRGAAGPLLRRLRPGALAPGPGDDRGQAPPLVEGERPAARALAGRRTAVRGAQGVAARGRGRQARLHGRPQQDAERDRRHPAGGRRPALPRSAASARASSPSTRRKC